MVRPPCCDQIDVKKGPWTPEEDIILVSYIQKHGTGNWRDIPKNTGLLRCSKSCRLRWSNYLRPGIRRGSFTPHEDKMIIKLQALLGNRWASIASYLDGRTDNDIKNHWNTHLKKRVAEQQKVKGSRFKSSGKGEWERRLHTDIEMAKKALSEALSPEKSFTDPNPCPKSLLLREKSAIYTYSVENISRLLKDWNRSSVGSLKGSSASEEQCNNCSDTVSVCDEEAKFQYLDRQIPFSLLEKWLLEDTAMGEDGNFMDLF